MAYISRKQLNVEIEQKSSYVQSHNLQMYNVPPFGYINLEEMRQWCIDRFRVLKLVEWISKQNYKKSFKDCFAILVKKLQEDDIHNFENLLNINNKCPESMKYILKRNDCISYFVLRSAFSFEYEKRLWFFKQEVKLFKWRLSCLNQEDIKAFSTINDFQFPLMSEGEKEDMKDLKSFYCVSEDINTMKFYKVPFVDVINLVAKRQVFLKNGIVYLPETKIFWLILTTFKRKLNEGFAYSRIIASNAYDDERLTNLFTTISNYRVKQHFKYKRYRNTSIQELDKLSQRSYPLCMRLLHEALKKNHHLTNGGRVQYCLFLKGIGLSLNDALEFWKNEFTQKVNEFIFEKEYKYTVRHLYGKEGKHAKYEPFPCYKIQKAEVGLRDNHGCPFKHIPADLLKGTLSKCGLIKSDVESVVHLSTKGSYLEACKMYYEITHNHITNVMFEHPNMYFNYSCEQFEDTNSDTED